uniref:Sema domain-containing protein n=1 Tax=Acrobeloides nanus TaxID=290746 RepID=A0A914DXR7_9BILA
MHNDPSVTKFGDVTRNDYFRLLEVDGKFLIVGAANKFFNLTIDGLKNISVEYDWPPGLNELKDCGMKTSDEEEDCKNYIRVLTRDDRNGNLLVCGTNAFKPLCRVLKRKSEKFDKTDPYETVLEFSGTGLSPLDPKHNSTFYREDDFLYAATVADFSGTDSLVFRRNISRIEDKGIRTIRDDIKFLNKPQFAGSLSTSNVNLQINFGS